MIKRIAVVSGLISIAAFCTYYCYAFKHWPEVPQLYNDLMNWSVYIALSASFFALGKQEQKNERYFIFYAIAQFWLFLTLTYIFNDLFNLQIIMHKVFIAISLTFVCSLLLYLWYWRR